jgi:hypothetical protein
MAIINQYYLKMIVWRKDQDRVSLSTEFPRREVFGLGCRAGHESCHDWLHGLPSITAPSVTVAATGNQSAVVCPAHTIGPQPHTNGLPVKPLSTLASLFNDTFWDFCISLTGANSSSCSVDQQLPSLHFFNLSTFVLDVGSRTGWR